MRQSALYILLWLLACGPDGLAAAAPQFMPTEHLRRGMRGVGRTVFQGTRIDTFAVEILGVLENALGPRQDLVLARLSGGPLEETGLIRGMSGSPVYVDGRLVGAVAYGWSFARVPICGITPIAQMLEVLERDMQPPAPGERAWGPPVVEPGALGEWPFGEYPSGPVVMEPLRTPVWVSGLGPSARAQLAALLEPAGLEIAVAPGGQAPSGEASFEPGAALGVQLVRGDMSITGIGTLTYVDGERVVGFGHPMMLAGTTDMPMTAAHIYDVVPTQLSSFKLGAATRPVGAIRQDRAPGIGGVLGRIPDMMPAEVLISSPGRRQHYRFELLRHQDLSASLARVVLVNALEAAEKLFGDATLELSTRLYLSGGRHLDRTQVYGGPTALFNAALEAAAPMETILQTPFPGLQVDSLRFEVALRERLETARIQALRCARARVEPGEKFALEIVLQPYRRAPERQLLHIELPADTAPGTLLLRAGSGSASRTWESQRRPDAFAPRDAAHLLEVLAFAPRDDELVVELFRPEPGLSVAGRELPGLPPSARTILSQGRSAGLVGPVLGQVLLRQSLPIDYVIHGEQSLELNVVRKP